MNYLKIFSPKNEPDMSTFTFFGLSQAISLLGSGMSWFVFSIWIWEQTGQASDFVLFLFYLTIPTLLLSPFAGTLIDRWDRKRVIIISDGMQGLGTATVLFLYLNGTLQIWHLYVVGFLVAIFSTFQKPTYTAAVTMMLSKEQYSRGEALLGLTRAASDILAPFLGAYLLGPLDIPGILIIDIATLIFALTVLIFFIPIPPPPVTATGRESRGSFWQESIYGFRYIFRRPGLFRLTTIVAMANFFDQLSFSLIGPMILASTANDERVFGSVQSIGALGATIGGGLVFTFGGPKRKIHGILAVWAVAALAGGLLMSIGDTLPVWATAAFINSCLLPVIFTSDQALWQTKVAPDVQGRVFVVRDLLYELASPIAVLLAGFFADNIFEPAMTVGSDSLLAKIFGDLIGLGPGTGMAVIILVANSLGALTILSGYLSYNLRNVEDLLPDYDQELAT